MNASALVLPAAGLLLYAAYRALTDEETVPYTNRVHRVISLPYDGDTAVDAIKKRHGDTILDPSHPDTVRVRLIMDDIVRGIHRVLLTKTLQDNDDKNCNDLESWKKQGKAAAMLPYTEHLRDVNWEVFVVSDEHGGARTKYNGKIIICTGLLNFLDTDAEIATILAHEMGHVVSKHLLEFASIVGRIIPLLRFVLPFSRRHEIEADYVGIMLLAAAGFDPRVAPRVFQRRGESRGESAWEDCVSSHPSYKTRAWLLSQDNVMEKALELYHGQVGAREGSN